MYGGTEMDVVFHSGDVMAKDALRISSLDAERLLVLAGYSYDEEGSEINPTELFMRLVNCQVDSTDPDLWELKESLTTLAQNSPGYVVYSPIRSLPCVNWQNSYERPNNELLTRTAGK
jgi:hypothetical protein